MAEKHLISVNDVSKQDQVTLKELVFRSKEWLNYLLGKWITILIAGIIGGLSGFIYAYTQKPVYTAETRFVLEEDSGGGMLGQLGGLAGLAGIDVGGGGGLFHGDNIIELYKSRRMIEKTLLTPLKSGETGTLIDKYIEINELDEGWTPELKKINFITDTQKRSRDSILSVIIADINSKHLTVARPDKKLSIISVMVNSPSEIFAKEFTDNIVANVNTFYFDTKTKKSAQNVSILQGQTDSVRAVMNGAIYHAAQTVDATPNVNTARQILRAPVQKSQFNAETNKAILTELVKNLELAKMSFRREAPLIQVIDQPVYPLRKDKLGKAKGILFGGLLLGMALSILLIVKKIYSESLNDQ